MSTSPDPQRQLSSLGLAVVLLTPDQHIAEANPAAEQFFGQSLRRLRGRGLSDLITFADPRLLARMTEGDAPISARDIGGEIRSLGPRRLDMTVAPVSDENGWQVWS